MAQLFSGHGVGSDNDNDLGNDDDYGDNNDYRNGYNDLFQNTSVTLTMEHSACQTSAPLESTIHC